MNKPNEAEKNEQYENEGSGDPLSMVFIPSKSEEEVVPDGKTLEEILHRMK